eukprot:TRINITY_DN7626_c1_g1_i1.p1 TRINITY_DN7626_c1_g1~~TRINITY_DN7626_c1_g1_i1.p1  ORF type:complete len:399 (+),score=136.12 TRINITY_DN7626_c1_g1_i1:57-1253(+)
MAAPRAPVPTSDDPDENLTLAIVLSLAAGLATVIGGMTVYVPWIRKISQPKVLSASLALSAGVMLYVSFAEIMVKSNDSIHLSISAGYLISSGSDPDGETIDEATELGFTYPGHKLANLYTALAFFGGMVIVIILERIVHALSPVAHSHDMDFTDPAEKASQSQVAPLPARMSADAVSSVGTASRVNVMVREDPVDVEDPTSAAACVPAGETFEEAAEADEEPGCSAVTPPAEQGDLESPKKAQEEELQKMGLLTALALGLHNFPEGFATFIATLQEPALGVALVVAIAIHNIPEGICVAMPVYYATGSKAKGLWWCFLSGLSEPIGGILGWAILKSVFTDAVFGVAFGAVGGMMVYIVMHELMPMAHKNDPTNAHTTFWLVVGMIVIAASLIAFGFA